jgi:hypothetical protein
MSVSIDVTEMTDREVAARLEASVRRCFSNRPNAEVWAVSMKPWGLSSYQVVVQGPGPKREKIFPQSGGQIIDEVSAWVGLYFPSTAAKGGHSGR